MFTLGMEGEILAKKTRKTKQPNKEVRYWKVREFHPIPPEELPNDYEYDEVLKD